MDANIPGLIPHYHEGVVDDTEEMVVVRGNDSQEIDHGYRTTKPLWLTLAW